MNELRPAFVASMLPLWLEEETRYAVGKHGTTNPQRTALDGGLSVNGSAYNDLAQYYKRFSIFYGGAEGNETLLLKASQALGKYVNAGRALLSVVLQAGDGPVADDVQLVAPYLDESTEELILVINHSHDIPIDQNLHWTENVMPLINDVDAALQSRDYDAARRNTAQFVLSQAQLFVDFTCEVGLIAQPGIDSTDRANELNHWMI